MGSHRTEAGRGFPLAPISAQQAAAILADRPLRAEAERQGIDLSLIVGNLKAPAGERIRRLQQGLRMVLAFRDAGRRARGEL